MTTDLCKALDNYVAIRRCGGFKLVTASRSLPSFVEFLGEKQSDHVTAELALAWAMLPPGKRDLWTVRLSHVRGFAKYLSAIDPRTEIPPHGLLRQRRRRSTPYLYSRGQIMELIQEARNLRPLLHASTYATLIGLVASTGLRRGEVIRLNREDLDWNNSLLTVHNSKFGKSRELPLHKTTMDVLRDYEQERDRLFPRPTTESFFVSLAGTRLLPHRIHMVFTRLVRRVGLKARSPQCRPRMHDLRHTFAVETVLSWYRSSDDVESKLPLLSTYLGHFSPASTYWYLSSTPELLALSAARLGRAWGQLP